MRQLSSAITVCREELVPRLIAQRRQPLGARLWRIAIFCSLFSLIFAPEFVRDNTNDAGSTLYEKAVGGFRYVDLAVLALAFVHLVCLACMRTKKLKFPPALAAPGLAFVACIAVAAFYGKTKGGTNLFFDWRALALGIALCVVWSFWLQSGADASQAVGLFAVYMAVRISLLYLFYVAGFRETLLGISIPVFDGPVLSSIVFAGLLGFSFQDGASGRLPRLAWTALAVAAALMVLLCMRRTYWGELGLGAVILTLMQRDHRARNLKIMALALAAAALILGAALSNRLRSFDLTGNETQFSADNADHLHDLLDAWYEVRQSPVLGIGLGTSYPTWHIRRWKPESVMVHNAPLHVWLKYGLAGLACYLWFHAVLLRWFYRKARSAAGWQRPFLVAAFAYLSAQFVMTLGFAPWPYSELQLTALTAFILAAALALAQPLLLASNV